MSDDGGYQLLKKIAAGGMAEVFLARVGNEGSLVVVKRMLPQFARLADYVEMFFDEGRVISLLRHPNIVRMREFGFQNEQPFLAMEYLDGLDLHALLKLLRQRHQRLPLACALYIVACMSAGLHHTHEARSIDGRPMGIIHRDVSPHNVVLTTMGEVKLIDFGIAKSIEREHATKGGTLKGKVRYMSPEQLRGLELDRRSDIYALGVLLYELAVGRSPYFDEVSKGEPVGEFGLMMAVTSQSILPPNGVAPVLAVVIQKAMATTAAQRYQTCADLILALESVAETLDLELQAAALMPLVHAALEYRLRSAPPIDLQNPTTVADEWYQVAATDDSIEAIVEASVDGPLDAFTQTHLDAATLARPHFIAAPQPMNRTAGAPTAQPSRSPQLLAHMIATLEPVGPPALHVITLASRSAAAVQQIAHAATMEGILLFDFGRVERLPQECIRAWLDFHQALAARRQPVQLYFGSCGPAITKLAARTRSVLGEAHMVSLGLPCQCLTCGERFEHVVDCEHDVALLHGPILSSVACPFCGGRASCDDDASFRVASAHFWGRPVPAAVRAALTAVVAQRRKLETIEKTIDGQQSQIRVRASIDGQVRWPRIFDGLEGDVTLDLALARLDDAAVAALRRALPALANQAGAVTLCGVPPAFLAFAEPAMARVRIESVACRCFCNGCAASRLCVVAAVDWRRMRSAGAIAIACPGCRLELRPSIPSLEAGDSDEVGALRLPPPAARKWQRLSWVWSGVAMLAVVAALFMWMVLA